MRACLASHAKHDQTVTRAFANKLVGTAGFEPATTSPPVKCATRLRHAPNAENLTRTQKLLDSVHVTELLVNSALLPRDAKFLGTLHLSQSAARQCASGAAYYNLGTVCAEEISTVGSLICAGMSSRNVGSGKSGILMLASTATVLPSSSANTICTRRLRPLLSRT